MKKFTKIMFVVFACFFGLGFLVSGCATVDNVYNNESGIVCYGNSVALVGDQLYFGNAFSDYTTFNNNDDYNKSASVGFLSQLNTKNLSSKTKDHSPTSVKKMEEEVVAQGHSFMFVLGQKIYYATPNKKEGKNESGMAAHFYNYTTIFSSDLNGDHKQEIYSTDAEISQIEALTFENKNYIVLLAGQKLVVIEIGNQVKKEVVAENVLSVALPKTPQKNREASSSQWNGNIYFTVAKEGSFSGSYVKKYGVKDGQTLQVYTSAQGETISFVGRDRDKVLYTIAKTSGTETYSIDLSKNSAFGSGNRFYASAVSDICLIATENVEYGYVFTTNSKLGFTTKNGKNGTISLMNDTAALTTFNVIAIDGRMMYVSTTEGVFKADLSKVFSSNETVVEVECTPIATLSVYDGKNGGFDGTYVYFYAKLADIEDEEDEKETEVDDTYYLYRANAGAENEYQLLGLTKDAKRHS